MFVTRRRIGRTGALLGTWCGATGPQELAEPVRVDRHQSRPGIGYSARKTAATGTCRVSRIGTARRGFTFPARDRAVRRGWPMARTWRWLWNRAGLESESGAAGTH
jgi:hypothetical protein